MLRRLFKAVVFAVLASSLTACFASGKALISDSEAAFPFQSLKVIPADGGAAITLRRDGGRYVIVQESRPETLRFKALGENRYLAQVTVPEDGEISYLYGVVRIAAGRKSLDIIKGVAWSADREIARDGQFGFSICSHDKRQVCLDHIRGYLDYVAADPAGKPTTTLQIAEID